ncbi:hypothetical protein FNJ62_03835 [Streptomyces benahoarensis]|uniref:Histidine ammonia-lyase n=1 Tax=Streptomyces benahoarensis TaxID=2595054 RepID=A0A553ZLZ4_9ACTN|nr:hypothetical protein FNJ62_03835 [Streptomyces benahoarensis]TSB42316.1 hypothetical protein FNZ23_10625 [Streptomyces benahoarensis]
MVGGSTKTTRPRGQARPLLDAKARERVRKARKTAERVTARRRVYGYTTGVGANRTATVPDSAVDAFGVRLLRSHSGGIGPVVPDEQTRAMLAVRLNQLLRGGAAIDVAVVDRIAEALTRGHLPTVHALGAIGTGDLSALGELGLTLAGELPWRGGSGPAPAPLTLTRWDALPLMSSGALTIGQSALAATDLGHLLDRVPLVAATTRPRCAAPPSRTPRMCTTSVRTRARSCSRRGCVSCWPRRTGTRPWCRIPSVCAACRRCTARLWTPGPRWTRCSPWRSTPPWRIRCSTPTRRATTTTVASTWPGWGWPSTSSGWDYWAPRSSPRPGSASCSNRPSLGCRPSSPRVRTAVAPS